MRGCCVLLLLAATLMTRAAEPVARFSVATYNLENYLLEPAGTRRAKPATARARIRETIRLLHPDVLAVQEIGPKAALLELRDRLKSEGVEFPFWDHVSGWDTNIFVGILSRFPIIARRPHTNESFLLQGRRFHVSRGFAEVDIRVNDHYSFTLIAAHLKSRRTVAAADEGELREQEALRLRETIEADLRRRPDANLVVVGDFNDTKDSRAVRTVVGRGNGALVDTRPAERNGDHVSAEASRFDPRTITWTHYFGLADSYERIDYILLSPGMAREWEPEETRVVTMPDWGVASDHRPIVASFVAHDE